MQFTNKINLKTRLISAFLAIVLSFCFMIPSAIFPITASANAADWDSVSVVLNGVDYDIYSTVTLPDVGNTVEMKLINPRGKDITSTVVNNQFVANIAGKYSLSYKKGNASTGTIYVNVVAKEVSFSFPANSSKIIPSKIANATKVVFPNPKILDSEGEEIENAVATMKLVNAEAPETALELATEGEFKAYTFANAGTYVMTYSYGGTESTKSKKITKTFEIVVEAGYETEQEISYTLQSSMPTSASQGVEVILPQVNGKDSKNNAIDVYTSIKVEHVGDQRTEMAVNDFKFIPTLAGNYEITYTVSDFYGNKTEHTYFISDVTNNIAPKTRVVANYVVSQEGTVDENTLVDVDDTIPTKIAKGTTLSIPAIFGKDNVEAYKDLKLVRRIKKGSTVVANLDDTSVEAYANNKVNEAVNYTFEDAGTYTIIYTANNGTNTTPESQKSFTVIVEEGFLDTVVPTVTVTDFVFDDDNNVLYSVKPNQKILVAYPSVIDYVDPTDASNTNVADKSPTLKTFMCLTSVYANVTTAVQGFVAADPTLTLVEAIEKVLNESNIASLSELELNEDGDYFEGTVPAAATGSMTIFYIAQDDSERMGLYTSSMADHVVKTIEVINTNDITAPTFTSDFANLDVITADQYDEVELKFLNTSTHEYELITASDTEDKNLQLNIVITGPNGEVITLSNNEKSVVVVGAGSTATATAKFNANLAGTYKVNYIAVDAGNNYTVYATTIVVASKATPSVVLSNYQTTQELGKVIIPKAFAYLDGELQDDSWISTTIIGDINKNNEVITVKYVATNPATNIASEEVTAVFTVKDTIAPTIEFEEEMPLYAKLVEVPNSNPKKYQPIDIVAFTVNDNGTGVDLSTIKITAKDNKGNIVKLIDSDNNEVNEIVGDSSASKFVPTDDGKYTITFTAQDFAGNTVTETRTIAVGDITPPELTIENSTDIPTSGKLANGKYALSLDITAETVKIVDAKSGNLDIDDYLSVTVTSPAGTAITADDDNYNYTLSEAGTYTIKYVAVDKAGNTTTKEFSLVISAESNDGSNVTEVISTIMLILSILVLVGVVWYFVKPAPKRPKTVATKEEENKEKEWKKKGF